MRPLTYELLYLGLAYPFREWADTGAAAGERHSAPARYYWRALLPVARRLIATAMHTRLGWDPESVSPAAAPIVGSA